jgi:UDP:flavonoid glycosyltransferase YjiC (YdhE family)
VPAGIDHREADRRLSSFRKELLTIPPLERRPLTFTYRFATVEAPAKVGDLRHAVHTWRPDLLVFETGDLAAPLVARALGVRSVHHSFGRLMPIACLQRAEREVAPLWRAAGLDPEPLCGVFDGTYVDICPPSFQASGFPDGVPVELERPLFPSPPGATPPAWLSELLPRPLVYVTLGTVFNDVATFRTLLDGLAELDVTVVMTVGRGNDPRALAPLPANAIVEQYVPQEFVLPHASAVVAHGGSGSILATFARGLPTLLVPQGADQFDNARHCAELGAGLVLMPGDVTTETVRDAVEILLADTSYRDRSRELAGEIAAMPHPGVVASRLAASA